MYCQLKHHHLLLSSSSLAFNKWRLVLHLAEVVSCSVAGFIFQLKTLYIVQQDFVPHIRENNTERNFIMEPISFKHNIELYVLHQMMRKEIGSVFYIHVINISNMYSGHMIILNSIFLTYVMSC